MVRTHGEYVFTTKVVEDRREGYIALELLCTRRAEGQESRAARVVFWDASGQFWLETFGTDVPLEIAEQLIDEAKRTIKVR